MSIIANMKSVRFDRATLREINEFPESTRTELAQLLLQVQQGVSLGLPVSRPMPLVRHGAHELRINDTAGIVRVFYYVLLADEILVFHAFRKKDRKTPLLEISTGQTRLKRMLP